MRISILILIITCLSGCAIFGNAGPMTVECTSPDRVLTDGTILRGGSMKFDMRGSGREFPDGIDATESPCGLVIPEIRQGQDRSPGLLGLLMAFIGI